jgi:hypothetical protein
VDIEIILHVYYQKLCIHYATLIIKLITTNWIQSCVNN